MSCTCVSRWMGGWMNECNRMREWVGGWRETEESTHPPTHHLSTYLLVKGALPVAAGGAEPPSV